MSKSWQWLVDTAVREVSALIARFPPDVRVKATTVPVVYRPRPGRDLVATGIEPDTLGLFEGASLLDGESDGVPPHIVLFLRNIWKSVDTDEALYRAEVRTTLLHEIGHYLGWEETDLEQRDLD